MKIIWERGDFFTCNTGNNTLYGFVLGTQLGKTLAIGIYHSTLMTFMSEQKLSSVIAHSIEVPIESLPLPNGEYGIPEAVKPQIQSALNTMRAIDMLKEKRNVG